MTVRLCDLIDVGIDEDATVSDEDADRIADDFNLCGNAFVLLAPAGAEVTHVRMDPRRILPSPC